MKYVQMLNLLWLQMLLMLLHPIVLIGSRKHGFAISELRNDGAKYSQELVDLLERILN